MPRRGYEKECHTLGPAGIPFYYQTLDSLETYLGRTLPFDQMLPKTLLQETGTMGSKTPTMTIPNYNTMNDHVDILEPYTHTKNRIILVQIYHCLPDCAMFYDISRGDS